MSYTRGAQQHAWRTKEIQLMWELPLIDLNCPYTCGSFKHVGTANRTSTNAFMRPGNEKTVYKLRNKPPEISDWFRCLAQNRFKTYTCQAVLFNEFLCKVITEQLRAPACKTSPWFPFRFLCDNSETVKLAMLIERMCSPGLAGPAPGSWSAAARCQWKYSHWRQSPGEKARPGCKTQGLPMCISFR